MLASFMMDVVRNFDAKGLNFPGEKAYQISDPCSPFLRASCLHSSMSRCHDYIVHFHLNRHRSELVGMFCITNEKAMRRVNTQTFNVSNVSHDFYSILLTSPKNFCNIKNSSLLYTNSNRATHVFQPLNSIRNGKVNS